MCQLTSAHLRAAVHPFERRAGGNYGTTEGQALAAYRALSGRNSSTALNDELDDRDDWYDMAGDGDNEFDRSREFDDEEFADPGQFDGEFDAEDESRRGARRLPSPPSALRGRAVVAAVAVGAFAAAGAGHSLLPTLSHHDSTPTADAPANASAVIAIDSNSQQSMEVQPAARAVSASVEAQQLADSQQLAASQPTNASFAKPAEGTVVSTFGGKYGTFRYGIEIANQKDTPIVAAANGTIIAAGPASGFGLWVKEQLSDGTTLVYARMDSYSVHVGQQVTAGEQIAQMGNRGFANGYTLHFEVWTPDGSKVDPEHWLNSRGITL